MKVGGRIIVRFMDGVCVGMLCTACVCLQLSVSVAVRRAHNCA